MCGIVGITFPGHLHRLSRMNEAIIHRGPDGFGEHHDPLGVAMGMRRLSIIDLEGGGQPMSNEDDSVWIVFNGEIYNAPDLRPGLLAKGHRFKTAHSDTEVLLHLYEECGESMLDDLNGMFAFVILDRKKRRLFGARDRMGIKPLHYCLQPDGLAFASEIKSLLTLPMVGRGINHEALGHFLSLQFIPAPMTIYRDVQKLPAGHFMTYDLDNRSLKVSRYWHLPVNGPKQELSEGEWESLLTVKMREAVKRWTLSDVPLAVSLSGGLDSSVLMSILAELGLGRVHTYSLGFGAAAGDLDELPLAREVARHFGSTHTEIILNEEAVLDELDTMFRHLDEPYAGGLPSWFVYQRVGRHQKVCLTGTGGDELFGNYGKYLPFLRGPLYRLLWSARQAWRWKTPSDILGLCRHPHGHLYHRFFSDAVRDSLLVSPGRISTEALIENVWRASGASCPHDAVAAVDFQLQLPEEFLFVTDRFSMAHSVEARVPFLDHELVETVFRMPGKLRTGGIHPKEFFRKMVSPRLPESLRQAPKRGFVLPMRAWTRGRLKPLITELLGPESLRDQGIFSSRVWKTITLPHLRGQRDHTNQVWTLFLFALWHRQSGATL
ncbi:MAG: asparagine synthase (glutamine-hydrolyzing) [Verrucomicrobiae bacterium]|nr:asparagine synthase (glutamine-hydrolyzing) [Verrucomicrobiae bacterium]